MCLCFIGYSAGIKGYKLWKPDTEKVLYSRSVIFHELKPSTLNIQSEEKSKDKKDVVEIPLTPNKEELKIQNVPKTEESSSSSESSEEEQ